jgi:hypothetical protein
MRYRLEKNPLGSDLDRQQDYRKSVENGFVTLLGDFGSLKNDTLKQKAAVLINLNFSEMDSYGQSRIRQAAQLAIDDPATATALKHMLNPLTKAPAAPVSYSQGRASLASKLARSAAPAQGPATVYEKSIATMIGNGISDQRLKQMKDALAWTAASVRHNVDRQRAIQDVADFNNEFGRDVGMLKAQMLPEMEQMTAALEKYLGNRKAQNSAG